MAITQPHETSFGPTVWEHLAEALAAPLAWRRVDHLLEALTALRPAGTHAIAQVSLWHLPESQPAQMQRIRGRYLMRPQDHEWDRRALSRLFASDMVEWANPGVHLLHQRLADAPNHEICDDYVAITSPDVWSTLDICRRGSRPLGFSNGYTHYWRTDALHCINTTVWLGPDTDKHLTDERRAQLGGLFTLGKPLFEQVLVHDAVGQVIRNLTERQRDVLQVVLAGLSEKEMAAQLHRSAHTIHSHVRELYRQFNVQSRAELMALFTSQELVDMQDRDGWA